MATTCRISSTAARMSRNLRQARRALVVRGDVCRVSRDQVAVFLDALLIVTGANVVIPTRRIPFSLGYLVEIPERFSVEPPVCRSRLLSARHHGQALIAQAELWIPTARPWRSSPVPPRRCLWIAHSRPRHTDNGHLQAMLLEIVFMASCWADSRVFESPSASRTLVTTRVTARKDLILVRRPASHRGDHIAGHRFGGPDGDFVATATRGD